jgi:hypothetical protein
MEYRAISFVQKFGLFREQWQPKVVAEMNDYQFKVVKLQGDFIWHDHKDTDETFIVIEGDLRIDFRDGAVHVGQERCSSFRRGRITNPTPRTRSSCSLSSRAVCSIRGMWVASEQRSKMSGSESLPSINGRLNPGRTSPE